MITTVGVCREVNGSYTLCWGTDDDELLTTEDLPLEFLDKWDLNSIKWQYDTLESISEVVYRLRNELDLLSLPDEHGGECLVFND